MPTSGKTLSEYFNDVELKVVYQRVIADAHKYLKQAYLSVLDIPGNPFSEDEDARKRMDEIIAALSDLSKNDGKNPELLQKSIDKTAHLNRFLETFSKERKLSYFQFLYSSLGEYEKSKFVESLKDLNRALDLGIWDYVISTDFITKAEEENNEKKFTQSKESEKESKKESEKEPKEEPVVYGCLRALDSYVYHDSEVADEWAGFQKKYVDYSNGKFRENEWDIYNLNHECLLKCLFLLQREKNLDNEEIQKLLNEGPTKKFSYLKCINNMILTLKDVEKTDTENAVFDVLKKMRAWSLDNWGLFGPRYPERGTEREKEDYRKLISDRDQLLKETKEIMEEEEYDSWRKKNVLHFGWEGNLPKHDDINKILLHKVKKQGINDKDEKIRFLNAFMNPYYDISTIFNYLDERAKGKSEEINGSGEKRRGMLPEKIRTGLDKMFEELNAGLDLADDADYSDRIRALNNSYFSLMGEYYAWRKELRDQEMVGGDDVLDDFLNDKDEKKQEEKPEVKNEIKVEEEPKKENKNVEVLKNEIKVEEKPENENKIVEEAKNENKIVEEAKNEIKVEEKPENEIKVEEEPKNEIKIEKAPKIEIKIEPGKADESFFEKDYPVRKLLADFGANVEKTNDKFINSFANGLVIFYALGEKGMSLQEVMNKSVEEKQEIGKEFIAAINAHSVSVKESKMRPNLMWFGEMCRKAYNNFSLVNNLLPSEDTLKNIDSIDAYSGSEESKTIKLLTTTYMFIPSMVTLNVPQDAKKPSEEAEKQRNELKKQRLTCFEYGYQKPAQQAVHDSKSNHIFFENDSKNVKIMYELNNLTDLLLESEHSNDRVYNRASVRKIAATLLLRKINKNGIDGLSAKEKNQILSDLDLLSLKKNESKISGLTAYTNQAELEAVINKKSVEELEEKHFEWYLKFINNIVNREPKVEIIFEEKTRLDQIKDQRLAQIEEEWKKKTEDKSAKNREFEEKHFLGANRLTEFIPDIPAAKEILKAAGYEGELSSQKLMDYFIVYAMGNKGMTPAEISNASKEKKEEIGKEFLADVKSHPVRYDATNEKAKEEFRNNCEWYGKLYSDAYKTFLRIEKAFPEIDELPSIQSVKDFRNSDRFISKSLAQTLLNPVVSKNPNGGNPGDSYGFIPRKGIRGFNKGFIADDETRNVENNLEIISAMGYLMDAVAAPAVERTDAIKAKIQLELTLLSKYGGQPYNQEYKNYSKLNDVALVSNNYLHSVPKTEEVADETFDDISEDQLVIIENNTFEELCIGHPKIAIVLIKTLKIDGMGSVRDYLGQNYGNYEVQNHFTSRRHDRKHPNDSDEEDEEDEKEEEKLEESKEVEQKEEKKEVEQKEEKKEVEQKEEKKEVEQKEENKEEDKKEEDKKEEDKKEENKEEDKKEEDKKEEDKKEEQEEVPKLVDIQEENKYDIELEIAKESENVESGKEIIKENDNVENGKEINKENENIVNQNENLIVEENDNLIVKENELIKVVSKNDVIEIGFNTYDRADVPHIDEREAAYINYGNLLGFREQLMKDLKFYRCLLNDNERCFIRHGVTDPKPYDYKILRAAMAECYKTLKNPDASFNEIRKSFDMFQLRALQYKSNHMPFIRSHKSEESAERHRIIWGIADLNKTHMKLYDRLTENLERRIAQHHSRGTGFKLGTYSFESIKPVLEGHFDREVVDTDLVKYFGEKMIDVGKNEYPTKKHKAEMDMIMERYVRKNGLDTEEKRSALKKLSGTHTVEEFAKNYLNIKYRDEISQDPRLIAEIIRINEGIRSGTYKKEVAALEDDFYFIRVVKKGGNWINRWKEVENKSDELCKNLKKEDRLSLSTDFEINTVMIAKRDIMNAKIFHQADEVARYIPVAKLLLNKVLTKPENRAMLHAYADSNDQVKEQVIRVVAEYIERNKPIPHDNPNVGRFEQDLLRYLRDSLSNNSLQSRIAGQIKHFYENVLFPRIDEQIARERGNRNVNEIKIENPDRLRESDVEEINTNSNQNANADMNGNGKGNLNNKNDKPEITKNF